MSSQLSPLLSDGGVPAPDAGLALQQDEGAPLLRSSPGMGRWRNGGGCGFDQAASGGKSGIENRGLGAWIGASWWPEKR